MTNLLQEDQELRPDLFIWNGAIPKERLDRWIHERGLHIPDDLAQFWLETGGGDLFESETILGPVGENRTGDDIDTVNESHRRTGLGRGYLVVHVGSVLTAIRLRDQKWVILDESSYMEKEVYDSFESWYRSVLRMEFADRYGLPPA